MILSSSCVIAMHSKLFCASISTMHIILNKKCIDVNLCNPFSKLWNTTCIDLSESSTYILIYLFLLLLFKTNIRKRIHIRYDIRIRNTECMLVFKKCIRLGSNFVCKL